MKRFSFPITLTTSAVVDAEVVAENEEAARAIIQARAARGDYDDEAREIAEQSGGYELTYIHDPSADDLSDIDPQDLSNDEDIEAAETYLASQEH